MVELDNRPELPEIFPQTDVTVEGEEHRFKIRQLDYSTQPKLEYTLDKAPVEAVQSIQGTDQNGNSRTFIKGTDYQLVSQTNTVQDEFTYDQTESRYLLQYNVDQSTDIVSDESGTTYENGVDYTINECERHYGDKIEWLESGNSPRDTESFTVVYDVTFPSSVIQWQEDATNIPQEDSLFYVTYRAESIISRYLDSHEEELDRVEDAVQEVINNKFVQSASGDNLDRLGRLFGPTIGKRRGRSDEQYRIYLKSIVQSFVSRGTVNGIKLAISAATDVPLDDIEINEDFENVEYEVSVIPNTPVTVSLLEEVAEIADPSGVNQIRTRFTIDPEEIGISDSFSIIEGNQISDEMGITDSVQNFGFQNEGASFEKIISKDDITINPNKNSVSDNLIFSDSTTVNPNTTTIPDENVTIDDSATTEESGVYWDDNNWNEFNWATEHN